MALNCIVITNGSRFLQGPADTGLVFVPPGIMDRLTRIQDFDILNLPYGIEHILGDYPDSIGLQKM